MSWVPHHHSGFVDCGRANALSVLSFFVLLFLFWLLPVGVRVNVIGIIFSLFVPNQLSLLYNLRSCLLYRGTDNSRAINIFDSSKCYYHYCCICILVKPVLMEPDFGPSFYVLTDCNSLIMRKEKLLMTFNRVGTNSKEV